MAIPLSGVKPKKLLDFFRKNRNLREIVSSAVEIQENLDWAMNRQVLFTLSAGSASNRFEARIVAIDHSPVGAFILLRALRSKEALLAVKGGDSLSLDYAFNRGMRFRFDSKPLTSVHPEYGEFQVGYPSLIESWQDLHAARFKNLSKDPIQVDVEKQRSVVIDIGLHGLKFTSNRVFEKGTLLKDVQIDLPRYGPVQGSAVVKYMQPSMDYPLWRYLCGVEFTEMRPRDQRRLNRYVNRTLKQG
jgi:c-di-GMP-binding flagellar brake protein YcgR